MSCIFGETIHKNCFGGFRSHWFRQIYALPIWSVPREIWIN